VSLRLVAQGLLVVVAILFGTAANAFAHAGHADALENATVAISDRVIAPPTGVGAAGDYVAHSLAKYANSAGDYDQSAHSLPQPENEAACMPGACCCQGASSCGMGGHCCASMMSSESIGWAQDFSNHMRFHLARLGSVFPDIVFGLDRPPKA
jgi:hypothetical protein